jgi:hypothetical protein
MTVAELIEILKTCDPKALVVVNEQPMIDFERDVMERAMQLVTAVQPGWTYGDIESDMSFSLVPVGSYLVPAVRILGVNHEETTIHDSPTINGVAPMKDVLISPIKKLESRER